MDFVSADDAVDVGVDTVVGTERIAFSTIPLMFSLSSLIDVN